jgi:abortive infection Abi-like protein/AbiTii-like protein
VFWRRKRNKAVRLYDDLLARVHTGPLPDLLASLVVLAKEIHDAQLEKWARLEHEGYYSQNPAMSEDVVVPEYRTVPGQRLDDFDRVFVIDDPGLQFINEHRLREGVAELEKHSRARGPLRFEDPFAAQLLRENLGVEVRWFRFFPSSIESILTAIRGRLLDQLYSLRPAIERYRAGAAATTAVSLDGIREAAGVDSFALHEHLRRIDLSLDTDPALAIGSAKELTETVAKQVLEHYRENPTSYKTFPQLLRAALAKLDLASEAVTDPAKGAAAVDRLMAGLGQVVEAAATLRNLYGTGHGRARPTGAESRHARVVVGACATVSTFLLETLQARKGGKT